MKCAVCGNRLTDNGDGTYVDDEWDEIICLSGTSEINAAVLSGSEEAYNTLPNHVPLVEGPRLVGVDAKGEAIDRAIEFGVERDDVHWPGGAVWVEIDMNVGVGDDGPPAHLHVSMADARRLHEWLGAQI